MLCANNIQLFTAFIWILSMESETRTTIGILREDKLGYFETTLILFIFVIFCNFLHLFIFYLHILI